MSENDYSSSSSLHRQYEFICKAPNSHLSRFHANLCHKSTNPPKYKVQSQPRKRNAMGCQEATRKSIGFVKVRRAVKGRKTTVSSRQTKKTVRFSKDNEVAFRHVTNEELGRIWYSRMEYNSFKSDCKKTANEYVSAGGDITRLNPTVCIRGLEQSLTSTSIQLRRLTIASYVSVVIHHQKHERDPEKLRDVCRVVSQAALNRARTVAAFDAKLCQF